MLKSVQLDDRSIASDNLEFVGFRSPAPLGSSDLIVVQGERITAATRLPTKSTLCESTTTRLLGEVEVNILKSFPVETKVSQQMDCTEWLYTDMFATLRRGQGKKLLLSVVGNGEMVDEFKRGAERIVMMSQRLRRVMAVNLIEPRHCRPLPS